MMKGCKRHPEWEGTTEFCVFCWREDVMGRGKHDPRMALTLKDMPNYGKTDRVTVPTGGNH